MTYFLPLCAISTTGTRFYRFVAFLRWRLIFTILSHFCEYDASFSLSAILRVRLIFTISSHFYGWNALLQFLIHFYECDAFIHFGPFLRVRPFFVILSLFLLVRLILLPFRAWSDECDAFFFFHFEPFLNATCFYHFEPFLRVRRVLSYIYECDAFLPF